MKTPFYLSLLVLALSSCGATNSEVDLNNSNAVNKSLIKTWRTAFIETNHSRVEVPKNEKQEITFYGNGLYMSKLTSGIVENKAAWHYESDKHMLYINDGKDGQRIKKLTKDELIIIGYTSLNDKIVDSNIVSLKSL